MRVNRVNGLGESCLSHGRRGIIPAIFIAQMHCVQSCKTQMHSLCDILSKNSEKSL